MMHCDPFKQPRDRHVHGASGTVADRMTTMKGTVAATDRLVITAGIPVGVSGTTNLVKVLEISRYLEPLGDATDT